MKQCFALLSIIGATFQSLSLIILSICAGMSVAASTLAVAGVLPWLELPISLHGVPVENSGQYVQIGITVLLISFCFTIPTNGRIMRLESAHRSFAINMEDVARAYALVHTEDRKQMFHARSEFDAVKERIAFLHTHPDLGELEPDILEVAAKMSRVSADLAEAFSDARIDRARNFLVQRQEEAENFQERLDHAKAIHADIIQWSNRVELDEAVARSQLDQLVESLQEILPGCENIGAAKESLGDSKNEVIRLPKVAVT